jgi:potassium-dependent mechanosensitive channel
MIFMSSACFSIPIMTKSILRLALLIAGLFLSVGAPLKAQTAPAPATTNATATNAPAATTTVKPFAPGEVVVQAQAAMTKLQGLKTGLDPDETLHEVGDDLPKLSTKIDQQTAVDERQSQSPATLNILQTSQTNWQTLSDSLGSAQNDLAERVHKLNQLLWDLMQMEVTWKATLDSAQTLNVPPEITGRCNDVRATIASATKAVMDHLAPIYDMQNKVATQDARTQSGLEVVNKNIEHARQELFVRNRPALWSSEAFAHPNTGVVGQERASIDEQATEVANYLKDKSGAVLIHLLLLVLLIVGFYWMRNTVRLHATKEPALRDAAHIFDVPLANALLISLLASVWLYADQPRLLWAAFGALALIPTVIVTRRLIDPQSLPILYATVIAFLVDQLRYIVTPAGILTRVLFIAELLAVTIFLLSALRLKTLCPATDQTRLRRLTRLYLHVAFFVFVIAGLTNVLGYTQLSILIGNGMLDSSYLAVVLYAAVRIADALAISALNIRPLTRLGMVRRHHDLLYQNTAVGMRWLFYAIWLVAALQFFSLLSPLWLGGNFLLWGQHHKYFNIEFTLGAILAFPITIWATFLLSRFIRFCLEEEVYPHMHLGRGIPYAASTMVHYTVLLIGFFVGVAATGTHLSQFAFLAGAFGVGLGFGLQNIMNNFVSGVILLFERPIKVGDVIQIDATTMGKVESIGIRASVILLANGAEVIVPNGNLISNPVTNWTLSNCERQIEIPVVVTSKVDPQHVIVLLTNLALSHPDVIKNPTPRAYLVTFGATALTFRLSVWIDSADEWMKVTSDLSVAINAALTKENIALG